MATIHCPSGHIFSDIIEPKPNKFYLIADKQSEELAEKIILTCKEADEEQLAANVHFFVLTAGDAAYSCPVCNRLLIIDKENRLVKSYIAEQL